jgi:queuosine precursor transporter
VRRLTALSAAVAFVGTVYLANWLVKHVGPIRVWPTDLLAPAGVYVIGLAFLLRDTVQRFSGQLLALVAIAAGTGLSVLVSPTLALASACAFAASELLGLGIFWGLRGNIAGPPRLTVAVVCASVAAAALDSYVFLSIAFHSLAFFEGQFVAKLSVTALALPFVLLARRRWPTARTVAA